MISVLILTLNEEINLPGCLDSVRWCDDIVIFDSFSTDQTVKIAKAAGARVFQREFDNYASQRNAALMEVEYKHPWVLMVDADEKVSPELFKEINTTIPVDNGEITLYRMRRKDFFLGKWIRRSSGYPTWFGRLIKIGHVWVERAINEVCATEGKVGHLKGHLLHYPFNKGFHSWFEKHNRYSTMEAELIVNSKRFAIKWGCIFNSDPAIRRKAIKSLFYRLPARPVLMFLALYFWRRGFLDGRAGLTYCLLRSFYEYMISCKVKEIRLRKMRMPL